MGKRKDRRKKEALEKIKLASAIATMLKIFLELLKLVCK